MILCETILLHKLSTKYAVISTEPESGHLSQCVVIALENNATILIHIKMKQTYLWTLKVTYFTEVTCFTFCLVVWNTSDWAHSRFIRDIHWIIISNHSVFSGNDCNRLDNIGTCVHLIEQLPPTDILTKIYNASEFEWQRYFYSYHNDRKLKHCQHDRWGYKNMVFEQIWFFGHYNIKQSNLLKFVESEKPVLVTASGLRSRSSTMGDLSMTIVLVFN